MRCRMSRLSSPGVSERAPDMNEERVVISGVAQIAIVIARRAVELGELEILHPDSNILDRRPEQFRDPESGIGRVANAAEGNSSSVVVQIVFTTLDAGMSEARPVLREIYVGGPHPQVFKRIGRVGIASDVVGIRGVP